MQGVLRRPQLLGACSQSPRCFAVTKLRKLKTAEYKFEPKTRVSSNINTSKFEQKKLSGLPIQNEVCLYKIGHSLFKRFLEHLASVIVYNPCDVFLQGTIILIERPLPFDRIHDIQGAVGKQ